MNVAVFSTKPYDREFLRTANMSQYELTFFEPRLTREAWENIAGTTIGNLSEWQQSGACKNAVQA